MTETAPDHRLWRVRWITYNGLHRARIYCTEHKRRHESACTSIGLPAPVSTRSTSPAARCRLCPGRAPGQQIRQPILGRAVPADTLPLAA